jgi:hypothetical protein
MYAYRVKAMHSECGGQCWQMIVYHSGSKKDVERQIVRDGWKVKRITGATADEIFDLPTYPAALAQVNAAIQRIRQAEADNARTARILEENEIQRRRQAAAFAAQQAEENRLMAVFKAIGDLPTEVEKGLSGNRKLATLCGKSIQFFDNASLNRADLLTAVTIDAADFQSDDSFPNANRLVSIVLSVLNEFVKVGSAIARSQELLANERTNVQGQINSIASRTHIFGGSGVYLFLSAVAAESAANKDKSAIEDLKWLLAARERQLQQFAEQAFMEQRLLEYRARTAISMLLAACGKSIQSVDLPLELQHFILGRP